MTENLGRINVAYITSVREIGLDEKVGQVVVGGKRRVGNLEDLASRSQNPDDPFSQNFNLVSIIVDDSDEQWDSAWSQGDTWNQDMGVCIRPNEGEESQNSLRSMTHRVSSQPWRKLRGPEKVEAKSEYEKKIIDILRRNDVDIVVVDSYVSLFADDLLFAYGRFNGEDVPSRIVNIHPAITDINNPARLRGLTPTRDAYTRANYGWIIVDDKHSVDVPNGKRGFEEYEGERREVVYLPEENRHTHGVTVHEVTRKVDNGPVIRSQEWTLNGESMEQIRERNYEIKRDLLTNALVNYVGREDVQQAIISDRVYRRELQFTAVNEQR